MRKPEAVKLGEGHYQIDLRGWICPYPKYAVEVLLRKLGKEGCLDLLVDCPAATGDVPRVAQALGYVAK